MKKNYKKIAYDTKKEALTALILAKKKHRDERIVYKCTKCKKYHLASNRSSLIRKNSVRNRK